MKRVSISSKPAPRAPGSDQWVVQRAAAGGEAPSKRLTIDISGELHRAMKVQCAVRGERMADVVRELLEQRFAGGQPEAMGAGGLAQNGTPPQGSASGADRAGGH